VGEDFDYVNVDFGNLVNRYLEHLEIDQRILAKYLVISGNDIRNIIAGKKGVVLKTAEKTASFFGLKYFQMANPDFPVPEEANLPDEILTFIASNKPKTYGEHDLNEALKEIFNGNFLEIPRTTTEIANELPHSIPSTVRTASRISDAIKKGTWDGLIAKLPKPDGERQRYQLVKFIGKYA